MDTVTYPKIQDLAAEFVCIRIDYDKNPELVAKYKVKPLPDVRILDSQGREKAKLVGFTSAAKLRAAMGQAPESSSAEPKRDVKYAPEAVAEAIKKGLAYLRSAKKTEEVGLKDLVLLARVVCKDSDVEVPNDALVDTYQTAFRAMALARLGSHDSELKDCAKFLIASQLENGQWTYSPQKVKLGDNSNTAYAILGLAACRKAGIEVPKAAFDRAAAWWHGSQNSDGGWGYRSDRETESYASMTESGIGSLLLSGERNDRAIEWLGKNFSVSENKHSLYQQGRLLYHLFALERVSTLLGREEWYKEGAAHLLSTQRADGSWDDGADLPVSNTCFGLLALARATEWFR